MIVVRINKYEILKYYTRESIKPKAWDFETKRAKEGKYFPEGWEINMRLEKYRLKFKSIFRGMVDQKIMPSRSAIKFELDREFFDFILRRSSVVEYFDSIIKRMEEHKILSISNKPYANSGIKTFKTAKNHLQIFEENNNRKLDFYDINMDFYYDYIDHLCSLNLATNGMYNPIKKLKFILRHAEQEGYKVNPAFRNRRFVTPSELTDKIYLTIDEIKAIFSYKYEISSQIDQVRDRFVLACCTGIRFSDYEQIRRGNILTNEHGEFVRIRAAKTGQVAVIPLNTMAKTILAKYDYELPKVIANVHFNTYLKQIGEEAKINQVVEISITRGGKIKTESHRKFELIQTHTARRSFATNLFLQGYSNTEIMKITGHKTEKEFLKYIRVTSEEVAFKMAQDPRFSSN